MAAHVLEFNVTDYLLISIVPAYIAAFYVTDYFVMSILTASFVFLLQLSSDIYLVSSLIGDRLPPDIQHTSILFLCYSACLTVFIMTTHFVQWNTQSLQRLWVIVTGYMYFLICS